MTFTGYSPEDLNPGGLSSDQGLARRLKLIQTAAPMFNQGEGVPVAMHFAQSDMSDADMVTAAQSAQGTQLIENYKAHLSSITDPSKQYKEWNSFDTGQKRLLEKAGFPTPIKPQGYGEDLSPWGITKSIVGGLVHDVTSVPGIKQGLEGMNYAAGIGTHLYRSARLGVEEEGLFGTSIGRAGPEDAEVKKRRKNIIGDFLNLWGRTEDGEETFSIKAQNKVHKNIPEEDKFAFVKALAGGKTAYDYLTEDLGLDPNLPAFDTEVQKYSQYQGQEDVINAVKDLRNNKYSPGMDLASSVGLGKGTLPFNIVSGGVDATFRILTDPTLAAGKVYKGYRVGAYGMDAALAADAGGNAAALTARVDYLKTLPRFKVAGEKIATRVAEGNEAVLLDELPQLRNGGLNDLNKWRLEQGISKEEFTSDHVFDFFKQSAGTKALGEGKFAAPHFPGTILPSASKPEMLRRGLAIGTKDWVEGFRLADYGFDALSPEQLKELFSTQGKTMMEVQKGVGNALHSFYTKVPKYDFISPHDDNGIDQFRALLDYSLPNSVRDSFVNDWIHTGDYAARRKIYESGVEAMYHYSGALATDEGKELLARALNKGQTFAADGRDLLNGRPVGIGERDMAEGWAIPDFKDMLQATGDTTRIRKALDYTNTGMINRAMATYWKPAVLLKAGFIPRAYGEEMFGFMLREGPRAWFKGQVGITASKEGYLLPLKPVGWIADTLLPHINYIPGMSNVEIYARNFAAGTSNFVRDWAEKRGPEFYIQGGRELAEQGGINAAGQELGTGWGEVSKPINQRIKNETIGQRQLNGDVVQMPVGHGEVTLHGKGDGYYHHTVIRDMKRMQDDRLYAPLMDAGSRNLAKEETESIVAQFADAGLLESVGPNTARNLLKVRNLVPNKVMPKFESWLVNESHASTSVVTQELIDNGVDSDTARSLVDNIGNLDPRHRVAVFTRDGELERMTKAHTLDPDAEWNFDSNTPYVRQEVEDRAVKDHEEILHELWSENTDPEVYSKIAHRRLTMADMHSTVSKSYRARETLDGRMVAAAPAPGSRRVYTVMMDGAPSSKFEEVPALARTNTVIDSEAGYIPLQTHEANSFIPGHTPIHNQVEIPGGEVSSADEAAWFTQDYEHATQIQSRLGGKYQGQHVSVGYVDVPEDVFQEGRNLAKANAAGGLDPLALQQQSNQVLLPKTWRDGYQAIGEDNFQQVSSVLDEAQARYDSLREQVVEIAFQHGGVAVPADLSRTMTQAREELAKVKEKLASGELKYDVGVGAHVDEAYKDWGSVIKDRYRQVFEGSDEPGMRDVLHKLKTSRATVKDIWDLKLPENAVGPAILEPSKESLLHKVVQGGFDMVGRGGNAMIRNQMFLHYYAQRLELETTRMATILGEKGATEAIEGAATKLGASHFALRSDWNSLPEDVRNATNPYEAMIARDPIPDSLRQITNPEHQKELANAFTALYEHDNPDLIKDAQKLLNREYRGIGYTLNDLQDSYIGLDSELRASILNNGLPDQIPSSFINGHELDADEWTKLRDGLNTNKHVYKTARDVAMKGAINDTIPWVDDHRVRSQFQQHGRNLFPFWFAQENFIKRTFANVLRDPAAIRKAELLMSGLHNTGVVTQNQFGEDVFNIPATGFLVRTLAKGADMFGAYSIPMDNPMTGQLKYALPGLDSLDRIGPSFSPVVAIPLEAVTRRFPELRQATNALLGQRGTGRSIPEMLMPSYAYKFYAGLTHTPGADEEMVSSAIQTAQMLEASGHGLPENATSYERDDYLKRLENHTRLQFMLKGVIGFFSPASPSTNPPEELTPEFQGLLQHMPLDEAILEFMHKNPDARSYTIFKTQVPSGAPLPATEEAGKVLDEHSEFFKKHPDAGPWLLPQNNDDTGFSNGVYNTEIARGLRERKSLKDWYDDYYFAAAATDYFDTKEDYDLRMAAAKGDPTRRAQLTDKYQTWKDGYLKEHTIFSELLVSPEAGQRRQRILNGISDALNDPDAPDVQHKEALTDLVDTYKDYQTRKDRYRRNTKEEQNARQGLEDRFTVWAVDYVDRNPQIRAFYDRVIRPEMS